MSASACSFFWLVLGIGMPCPQASYLRHLETELCRLLELTSDRSHQQSPMIWPSTSCLMFTSAASDAAFEKNAWRLRIQIVPPHSKCPLQLRATRSLEDTWQGAFRPGLAPGCASHERAGQLGRCSQWLKATSHRRAVQASATWWLEDKRGDGSRRSPFIPV